MNSETPQDGIPAADAEAARRPGTEGEDTPGSLGLENLEPSSNEEPDGDGVGVDSNGESMNFLTAGERKLSPGKQRQILAGRRRSSDDDTEQEMEICDGRRFMREKAHAEAKELKADDDKTGESGSNSGSNSGSGSGSGSGGAAQAPDAATAAGAESTTPQKATAAPTPNATPSETALLNDPANPNKPMFDAVLKGVGDLDPARVALTPAERTNVAAALTASMTQTQGFPREQSDVMQVSVAVSDKGDRVFAINGQNPDAPNAVYISVAVDQARAQPLDVSTAQAIAPQQQELQPPKPVQEQSATIETPAPRAIV